jgi:hypothetical protein
MKVVRTVGIVFVVSLIWLSFARAQSWQPVHNQPTPALCAALLLTDGTVMIQDNGPNSNGSPNWWKLTPDQNGSYINGTWSQLASMPPGYGPLYYASAVLADGRVVVIGGEYNSGGNIVETNLGAVYNPKTNIWTPLSAPNLWNQIGDAPSSILPNGKFLLGHIFDTQLAMLDPETLTWTLVSSTGKADSIGEEGWTLLPDGTILTVDVSAAPGAQKYISSTGQWISAGSTPASLATSGEIGPAVLRPNGTVFATGANGHNAVYIPPAIPTDPGTWVAAPDFPDIIGQGQLDVADGPAALLPNGNVLVAASPGVYQTPTHFFEFDGTNLNQVVATPNASNDSSFYGRMLLLPTGQVLFTDTISTAEIYTSTGSPNPAWSPTITSGPTQISPGATYTISGRQFNGLSQAVAYGDDYQAATNYPLVRITNRATGHVFYARTHDHSTMAVATGTAVVSTHFDVPANVEFGPSDLVVVANGIPSAAWSEMVLKPSAIALASSLNPSVVGQSVTFTATVTSTAGGTPTGTVTFLDGTTSLGSVALNASGVALFSTSSLALGSHSITLQYGGSVSYAGSTSPVLSQVVNKQATSTAVGFSLNPSTFGQAVTFTATVKAATSGTPTGTVTFKDGATTLATVALSAGKAAFATSTLTGGTHSITAVYGGSISYAGSTSPVLSQVVNKQATSTAVGSSLNPSTFGQAVTFTATVKAATSGTPTGTVTLKDGATTLATGTLSGGKATFATSTLSVGTHSITATYPGDTSFTASASPKLTQTVNKAASSNSVASSLNPSTFGKLVTFTATVKAATSGTPTGTVTFMDGTTVLGMGTLSGGKATFATSGLTKGMHSIAAVYGGDGKFTGSTSPVLKQTVN